MNTKIYLSKPHLSGKEVGFIKKALDSNWIASIGPSIDEFEKEFPNQQFKFPIILKQTNSDLDIFIDKEELNRITNVQSLIEVLDNRFKTRQG